MPPGPLRRVRSPMRQGFGTRTPKKPRFQGVVVRRSYRLPERSDVDGLAAGARTTAVSMQSSPATIQRYRVMLRHIAAGLSLAHACELAGINRAHARRMANAFPDLAASLEDARAAARARRWHEGRPTGSDYLADEDRLREHLGGVASLVSVGVTVPMACHQVGMPHVALTWLRRKRPDVAQALDRAHRLARGEL